nr:MAG TPA: hypothetical protein [Crassvirales sp.]
MRRISICYIIFYRPSHIFGRIILQKSCFYYSVFNVIL